ncbi:hypothetical protein F4811DRAFT_27603 [Daldinia bambusicola]|nr:hypothetical protein F4811DRAFT_27603 [Daldinia bambusicola]
MKKVPSEMSTENQRGHGHRELVKGKLRPPSKPPSTKSYTVTSPSINEVLRILLRSHPRPLLNRS